MDTDLRESIAFLYQRFSRYGDNRPLEGCSCCVDPRESERLWHAPLPSLSVDDLDTYAAKAMTTWGDVGHFKRFLPRLLELAATEIDRFTMPEVLFGKLADAEWRSWPGDEASAVDGFLDRFWIHSIVTDGREESIGTVLCSLAHAKETIGEYLDAWICQTSPAAFRNLARFLHENGDEVLRTGWLFNPFWERRSQQQREVLVWLCRPSTSAFLHAGSSALDGFDRYGYPLSDALSLLEAIERKSMTGWIPGQGPPRDLFGLLGGLATPSPNS